MKIKESEKKRQILKLCQRTEKTVEYQSDSDTNCNWSSWNGPQRFGKRIERTENQRTNQDYPDYNIVKIG